MVPYISPELLKYLNEQFPNRCARPGEAIDSIREAAGARQVVAHLEMLANDQLAESLRA